jgi:exosortase
MSPALGMSSALQPAATEEAQPRVFPFELPAIGWFLALLVVCYAPILYALGRQWATDEDMGHGFFVPAVAAYIAWQKREELKAAPLKSNWLGLILVVWAAMQSIVGTLGAELFVSRTSFVFAVIGCVLWLGGAAAIRILAFPLILLFFMIPIPAIIYNQITFPLQLFASQCAEFVFTLLGVPVIRDGNVIEIPSQRLSVVEACSGIRSLLSLSFLSLVYGFFFDGRRWMRWVLLASTVPIAITANAGRVTITGILSEVDRDYAQGVYHSLSGWVVFMAAMVIMIVFHLALVKVVARVRKRS